MESWRENLIDDPVGVAEVLRSAKRVAVLGIKTENQAAQPAFFVADYLHRAGFEVIPVPVYYPDVSTILGKPVHRSLASIPHPLDLVVVFRRPRDVEGHVDDILEARPAAVWMQSGIRNDDAARRLAEAGIKVVQDRCAMVEHRRMSS